MGSLGSKPKEQFSELVNEDSEYRTKRKPLRPELKELYTDKSFFVAVLSILALLFGGALIIHFLERDTGSQWYYLNCVYFCTITITTIGYGDLVPITVGGKVFVMLFTTLGVGLIAYSLAIISQKFVQAADLTIEFTKSYRKRKPQILAHDLTSFIELDELVSGGEDADSFGHFKVERSKTGVMYNISKNRKLWIAFIFYLVMITGGAAVFNFLETDDTGKSWGYFNSIYFCFVTLATIGYGDFHPTKDASKIFFICYTLLGLGFLTFFLQAMGKKFLKQLEKEKNRKLMAPDAIPSTGFVDSDLVLKNLQLQVGELAPEQRAQVLLGIETFFKKVERE